MVPDIFISYSTKDQKTVKDISQYLEQNGIRCFVAFRDIPKSVVWAKAITEAIENCKMMVVVFSEHANSSEQMDREIELCVEEKKPVLTFRIQNTNFTGVKKFYLKNITWIDAFPNPEKSFGELLKSVQILLPDRNMDNSSAIRPVKERAAAKTKVERENEKREAKEVIVKREPATTTQQKNIKSNTGFESKPVQPPKPETNFKNQEPAAKPKPASHPHSTKKPWAVICGIVAVAILLVHFVISIEKQYPIQNLIDNMVLVTGGTFNMGCTDEKGKDCLENETPAHEVTVDSFSIGRYPITVRQFQDFVEATGYKTEAEKEDGAYVWNGLKWEKKRDANWKNPYFNQTDNCPVTCVSWNDADAYCKWLSEKMGKNYRLPTEAEWEFAARGGNESRGYKYSGRNTVDSVAWYKDNSEGKTHDVGKKQANELGLHDMSGNVWEWCQDWYSEKYYEKSPPSNPKGPDTGFGRVVRGGGWYYSARSVRVSNRDRSAPTYRNNDIGFRLASSSK